MGVNLLIVVFLHLAIFDRMMFALVIALAFSATGLAELTGHVGPTSSFASKAANKICSIVDYGASTNGSDIGDALSNAWGDCAVGGLVYIPPGNYSMSTFPQLKDGSSSAVQLDGVINRVGSDGDNMLSFRNCQDFEFFSGNSKGALQGYGYEYLSDGNYGPRLMRFQDMGNFSVHGIALIDSPSYYLTLDTVSNGEIYNIIMRGPTVLGATDAIDVWGQNIWIHDIEATNGDECVTVKNPSSNLLIESIYCNLSGGNAIGSLGTDTNITNVTYRHIYANGADPCFIKSNGGSGTVSNVLWDTVIVRGGAYPLAIDSSWGSESSGVGILYTNFTYRNWHGYNSESSRPVIRLQCPADVPCTEIKMENVNLWSDNSTYAVHLCENAYGSGACIRPSNAASATYEIASTLTHAPSYATASMPNDFTTALLANSSFTIPAIPTTFYPGLKPSSSLLHLNGPAGRGSGTATPSSSVVKSTQAKTTTAPAITSTPMPASTPTATTTTNCEPNMNQVGFEHGGPRRLDHLGHHNRKHHWT